MFNFNYIQLLGILFCHIHNGIAFFVYFFNLMHTCSLGMSSAGIYVKIISIKLNQIFAHLKRINTKLAYRKLKYLQFEKVHYHMTTALVSFFYGDQMFGRLFLTFILVNAPISCILFSWIVHKQVEEDRKLYIYIVLAYQFIGSFGVHLFMSFITRNIHRIGKCLIQMVARRQGAFRKGKTLIRLSHLSMALHTTTQYGFHYATFGLVTINNFVKYLLIYAKVIMISYKLIQNQTIQ